MNFIIRWYNANRKTILTTAGAIIAVVLMIKLINGISQNQPKTQVVGTSKPENITNTIMMESNKSAVSGQKLSAGQQELLKTLDEFANYCNNGDIDKAYSLLSEDCKKEMYSTKEFFEVAYYNQVFAGNRKEMSAENWVENIYKVKFKEDPLTTGILDDRNTKQDYITIIEDENGNIKLNINGYIGKEKINKIGENAGVQIRVVESNVHMDYQSYTYEIINNSNKTILVNDPKLTSRMYIEDRNGIQYQAYTHEIATSQLKVIPKQKSKLTVKYYSKHGSNKRMESIVFDRIVLDYDEYSNADYYNNYGTIQIDL